MSFQPVIPLPLLIPLALVLLALVAYMAWNSCRQLSRGLRFLSTSLALLAVAGGLALLLNPGHEESRPSPRAPIWLVALDSSRSMGAPLHDDATAEPRIEAARRALDKLARQEGRDIRWLSLAEGVRTHDSAQELAAIAPTGAASDVLSSLATAIETLRRQGRTVAGAVLLGDGRDTNPRAKQQLLARAGAAMCPVHTLCLGETWQEPDFALTVRRPLVHAYPGMETRLDAQVTNTRMGTRQVQVELRDATGNVLETKTLEIAQGETRPVSFNLASDAPLETAFDLSLNQQAGESNQDNNSCRILVKAADARIRVFMAEGSPYWDSKFLAQYLRGQQVFDVRSVHRLSDKRFYHINSGDRDSEPGDTPDIPTTLDALMGYDMIVLGKGMEHLLDADSVRALTAYVREQGGLLVMARGRCFAGRLPGMEALEPFIWGDLEPEECRLMPTAEGEGSGLFGALLPAPEAEVWSALPPMEDVWAVQETRPGTRVLAAAEGKDTPMLGLMRHGMGAIACINGEGLWKWDFYPDARAHGNMYRDFWRQFLPWVQTAAEFQPGYDLSLHPERVLVREGEAVSCQMGWRGLGRPTGVRLTILPLGGGESVATVQATAQASSGLPRWEAMLPPLPPGEYLLRAEAEGSTSPAPECRFSVQPPPAENDCLDADPALLAQVAEATGGLKLSPGITEEERTTIFALPPGSATEERVYRPLWSQWWVLAFIVACLGGLWFIRRRKGLP